MGRSRLKSVGRLNGSVWPETRGPIKWIDLAENPWIKLNTLGWLNGTIWPKTHGLVLLDNGNQKMAKNGLQRLNRAEKSMNQVKPK
jgi:hypothetical protein